MALPETPIAFTYWVTCGLHHVLTLRQFLDYQPWCGVFACKRPRTLVATFTHPHLALLLAARGMEGRIYRPGPWLASLGRLTHDRASDTRVLASRLYVPGLHMHQATLHQPPCAAWGDEDCTTDPEDPCPCVSGLTFTPDYGSAN